MKKKIFLLLFSLVILCVPLIQAQTFSSPGNYIIHSGYFNQTLITSEVVTAGISPFSIVFDNSQTLNSVDGVSFDRNLLTANFAVNWNSNVEIKTSGIPAGTIHFATHDMNAQSPSLIADITNSYSKKAYVSFYGINASGAETFIKKTSTAILSGTTITFSADELTALKKYNKIRIQTDLSDVFADSETKIPVDLVNWSSIAITYDALDMTLDIDDYYAPSYSPTPTISNSRSETLILSGEPDTKISGLQEQGGHSSDHALNIAQSGTGVVVFNQCNLTSLLFSLINVDLTCQGITNFVLQDASGNVKKTFSTADFTVIGTNQIQLSLSNVVGISDNDKLQIALTNACTTNHESDYTIVLSTEGKNQDATAYMNTELFPDGKNKVPIAITQKSGTTWCDNSSAYFFNVSGPNGYTNINFSNTTPVGASFSVAKGQSAITGTANYFKCLTGVTIPIPATHMPKTPAISNVEYCNGTNFTLPINNSTDYSTETFRLLLDGTEKVGWQGTKNFSGINLAKVGTASAVVESTNGECTIASNTATITSAIQPIALAFNGSLSYYTEQVNTTIVQTTSQAGVTYSIYKDGSATPQDTWIGIKAQTLTKGTYLITATNADASCSANTTVVIVEKDLNIGSAWTTSTLSFCQLEGTKDLNSFVSFNGASSVVFTSTSGLSITGSNVDLAASTPGTYTITCTAIKDGVTKVFTKDFTVKPKANDMALSLVNSTDFACNTDNPQLQVTTDYPSYVYTWYKGATVQSGNLRTNTIPLTKGEGSQNFTVVSTAPNGCLSSPSPALTLIKYNLTADINFSTGVKTYCQSVGGTANVFDDLTGSDRIAISLEQSGWTYNVTTSSSDMIIINRNQIDLERSKAGTYTVTMSYSQNGCTKTITKQYTIKQMPAAVTVTLDNASTIECDLSNPNAQVHASNSNYTYNWLKKGVALADNTQAISVPVSKADGLTNIYSYPVLDGCIGLKSNEVSLTKRYVVADVAFSTGVTSYCQITGGSVDIFTELSGTDKIAVTNSQSGFTWSLSPSGTGLKITGSTINLETSQAGTYTVTMTINNNGCSKTITKDVLIRVRPADFTISQTNPVDFACNNSNAALAASVTSYTYAWKKGGVDAGSGTTISIPTTKADVSDASRTVYAIGTAANGCQTNPSANLILPLKTFLEADISISSGTAAFCQSPVAGGKTDIFDFFSGADKLAVTTKQHYDWTITATGLTLASDGHSIDLYNSVPGTYTVTFTYQNDFACAKTLTKTVVINPRPVSVSILMSNAATIECDLTNPNALVQADNSGYSYNWTKNGTAVSGNTQAMSIPVSKVDGLTTISAVPVLNGCIGLQSNTVTLTKRFVEADLTFVNGNDEYCQTVGTTLDMRSLLSGSDKDKVTNQQDGYTWDLAYSASGMLFTDTKNSIINLEKSYAQTYTSSLNIHKDGCSKTLTKDVKIKPRPISVDITLQNATDISCNPTDAQFKAAVITGYSYNWTKNGTPLSETSANLSLPISKADGLTNVYAVPVLDGCTGVQTNTISVQKNFVEADLKFSDGVTSYCQKASTSVDLFTELSGNDKLAIQGKQNGWGWSFSGSTSDLVIAGSSINLETSAAGTYTVSMVITKDGCSKTITKQVVIKDKPSVVAITLDNAATVECDLSNPNALVHAENSAYSYNWTKNGVALSDNTQSISVPVSKADGLTSISAVPVLNGCVGVQTNTVSLTKKFVEADLTFSTGVASYCQYPATKVDLFTELSGTDKLAIQGKQNGWGWTFSGSTSDLVISGSSIDLEKSASGTYTVSMVITKDGCSKTITKSVVVKDMPSNVAVTLDNAATIECDLSNPNAQVHADNSAYSYNWTKNGTQITGTTQAMSIPVSKADGLTTISAVPVLNGCVGLQTNSVSLTKRFVEADFGFNNTAITLASKDEAVNLFDYTVGKDKDAIINQTGGFTYKIAFSPVKQTAIGSTDGTVVPASGLQSGDTQYTLNVIVSKNGCDLTYSKTAIIKSIPRNITIDFAQAQSSQECTSNNYMNVVASDSTSGFVYSWYKNDVLVAGQTTYKAAIEVFKTDGTVKIYAIPSTKDGFAGYKTNILNTTKRYVTADLQLDQTTQTLCAVAGSKINVFDYVRGNDKAAVLAGQYGYTYNTVGDCGTAIATNQYVDVDNSLADDNATKTVSLTVSQNGCSVTQNKTFVIKRRPSDITIELLSKASNTTNNNLFCGGDTLSLHVSSSNTADVSYNWYKNGALMGTTTTPTYVYPFTDATGTINLSATSIYTSNSCPSTASNVITVQKKDVNFSINMASDPIAYCPEAKKINLFDYVSGTDKNDVMTQSNNCSYEFTASGNNGLAVVSYSFLDLDNSTSATNPYTLTFNVNKQGCTKAFTRNISIKPRPVTPLIALTSNKELRYCGGDGVSFTDQNAVTGTSYKWNVNGTTIDGTSTLNYATSTTDNLAVQATAYLTSNSCPSKASNILSVSNVLPQVEIKLISQKVTVNDNIQLYIYEPTASKSITLTATRVSDKTISDLPYTRNGNVITLTGILPIGEYEITAVAANAISGYCSQNITVPGTLTVTAAIEKQNVSAATAADEAAIKSLFDETMLKLKAGEVHAVLLPIMTTSSESAKLTVYTNEDNESVIIHVLDINGSIVSSRTEFLNQGQNDFTIEASQKPTVPCMYLVNIQYSKANKSETLKGLIK